MGIRYVPSCMTLSHQHGNTNRFSKQITVRRNLTNIRRGCIKRPEIELSPSAIRHSSSSKRVFVISDLHIEYPDNMRWIECLPIKRNNKDVLLVAGDVAETYKNFVLTMSLLKERFEHVFYVPGNHDLWCRREGQNYLDSLEKLNELLDACRQLGVETNPVVMDDLGIIPLFSWYHEVCSVNSGSFCLSSIQACKDYNACKWPKELSNRDTSLASYFDVMNEKNKDSIKEIKNTCSQIITFSHFVPRQELCPEKRMLFYPNLPKIIGSDFLEARIRSILGAQGTADACHVFGHTHFCLGCCA